MALQSLAPTKPVPKQTSFIEKPLGQTFETIKGVFNPKNWLQAGKNILFNRADNSTPDSQLNDSPLGITLNTLAGIVNPKTWGQVGKQVGQGAARSIGSVGLGLTEPVNHEETLGLEDIHNPTVRKVWSKIFGDQPMESLAKRVADNELKIKNSPFAQKTGMSKAALPLAFAGVVGDAALNLTPFGGGESQLIDQLAKETTEEGVIQILTKANIPEDIAKQFAPHFAETKTAAEAEDILHNLKAAIGTQKMAEAGAETGAKTAEEAAAEIARETPTTPAAESATSGLPSEAANIPPETTVPPTTEGLPQEALPRTEPPVPPINETNPVKPSFYGPFGDTISQAQQMSIDKIQQALTEATPIRAQQEAAYTAERGARLAKAEAASAGKVGEEKFASQLGQLKGEMPKVQFEGIRGKVGQDDINNLFGAIQNAPHLDFWEKLTAQKGLAKLFGEFGGTVPTDSELEMLKRVFPKEFVESIAAKRPFMDKAKSLFANIINVPKALRSSFDLSAPFRQGLFLINHPKAFFGNFPEMIKAFGSETAYKEIGQEIASRPTYNLMKDAKLALTDISEGLSNREEAFLSSLAEKIPIVGKVVRASERAYVGFLNKLRADTFDQLIKGAEAAGRDPSTDEKLLQGIGDFINTFSGRGKIGSLEKTAQALNGVFFSPRLMMSRLQILNPVYYIKADPFVRKEALKSVFTVAGAGMTMLGLAHAAGAKVGLDPTSADFGKIIIGNTRFDIWGGTQQYVRMAAQLVTGKYTSTTTGKVTKLGEGYKPLTRLDIITRQLQSKESPIAAFITDLLRGTDYTGQPVKVGPEVANLFTPLFLQDIHDVWKNDPGLLPIAALGGLGVGVQSYTPNSPTSGLKPLKSTSGSSGGLKSLKGASSSSSTKLTPLK